MRYSLFLLALASTPAAAAPTYLSCTLDQSSGPVALQITVDEANQVATLSIPSTGAVDRRPAVFTATEVSFNVPLSGGYGFRIAYVVSRTDLTIARTVVGLQAGAPTTGTCKIEEAPKRAF